MDINLLKEVLSIPTYFGREELIRDFLVEYGIKNKILVKVDAKRNVYLIKGTLDEGEHYPCVVAHMDTVHYDQTPNIDNNNRLTIHEGKIMGLNKLWASKVEGKKSIVTGIGGDDKAGIFICLELINKFDKIIGAFFVEEEFGCKGSAEANKDILKDVGYFIQFDAPYSDWCSFTSNGVQLFNKRAFNKMKPVLTKYGITKISQDPYTDIHKLKQDFNVIALNFFAGYHEMHTNSEFVIVEHIEKSVNLGFDMISTLGLNKHVMKHLKRVNNKFYREIHEWVDSKIDVKKLIRIPK